MDYALFDRTPDVSESADIRGAMTMAPMLKDLMDLQQQNQRTILQNQLIKKSDLDYASNQIDFRRKQQNEDEFNSYSKMMSDVRDQTGGNPEAMQNAAIGFARNNPTNPLVMESVKNFQSLNDTVNAAKRSKVESAGLDFGIAHQLEQTAINLTNLNTAHLQAQANQRLAQEAQSEGFVKDSQKVGDLINTYYNADPVMGGKIAQGIARLSDPSVNRPDIATRILGVASLLPDWQNFESAFADEFRSAGEFNSMLRGIKIDPSGYGSDPEKSKQVDSQIESFISSGKATPQFIAGYGNWKELAKKKADYFTAVEKAKEQLEKLSGTPDAATLMEVNGNLAAIGASAGSMRSEYVNKLSAKKADMQRRKDELDIQDSISKLSERSSSMMNEKEKLELKKKFIALQQQNVPKERILKIVGLALKGGKDNVDINSPEFRQQLDSYQKLLDDDEGGGGTASGTRITFLP